jgi:hypothetical protein
MKRNKKITVEPLFNTMKRLYIYLLLEDSEVLLVFECNNAGLKKLPDFV